MIRKIRSVSVLLLLVPFALAMAACMDSSNSNTRNGNASMAGNANSSTMSNAVSSGDREFMAKAAIGGMEEVELGRMAVQKGVSPDVKKFGERMAEDHAKAGNELKGLAGQKNVSLPMALDAQHQEDVDKLSKLSGAAFDREYMSMMVKDHVEDVAEFERAAASSSDSDLKAWAAKTLPTLREHLQMAQAAAAKVGAGGGAMMGAVAGNKNASGNANRRP